MNDQPEFGLADLTNCEREQIHLAASIQPMGALLVVRQDDHVIVQASAGAASFLGLSELPLDRPIHVIGDFADRLAPCLRAAPLAAPQVLRCHGRHGAPFDALVHQAPGRELVIEFERAGPRVDVSGEVADGLKTIVTAASLRALCDDTARLFRHLTGYDRVMVYRFDEAGHGEVFSEQRRHGLEAFLGNRYPASDIPQIARRLYERNRVRVLADVDYEPEPLVPRLSPVTGADLDMSMCFLRSMSPIHLQYLKNMGVAATLVVSVMVGGRLWGLIACHHYEPRFVHYETRAACELLVEALATRIAALESFVQAQAELAVRRLEHRMSEAIRREGDWRIALFDGSNSLLQPVAATGAALLFEGQALTAGEVPATPQLREIASWLDGRQRWPVFETASLGLDAPEFAPLTRLASGLLATRVSNSPGEYLMWFRPEVVTTVTWAGDPFKQQLTDTPALLSPRRSFAQWHQQVEGTSAKWTQADIGAARLIGETITDVVLQFRSVRMLIAQDQLEQVVAQVRVSAQPVIVADPSGKILLRNEAFTRMTGEEARVMSMDDLPKLFSDPAKASRRLREMRTEGRDWRGEVWLQDGHTGARPLLIRGDVVSAPSNRVIGYVLLFTDLTERHAADAARQRFQEGIIEGRRPIPDGLGTKAELTLQALLGSVVENAQLAALEITDGSDLARMPHLLGSVQDSVNRAVEVLHNLVRHGSENP